VTGDESAVTLRAVARRVGIATPSIYRHFPDRPRIMLAAVRAAFVELEAALRTAVAASGDDPRRRLFAVCQAYLEFARAHPGRYRTMFGGVRMPDVSATAVTEGELVALGEPIMAMLTEALQGLHRRGALHQHRRRRRRGRAVAGPARPRPPARLRRPLPVAGRRRRAHDHRARAPG
jgi:AcrR family transcriptional regulator